jgi:hypothetical protein
VHEEVVHTRKEPEVKRKSILIAVVVVLAAAAIPMLAVASSGDNKLTIATHQTLTSPSSAAGTFAAVGDIDDSGTVQSEFTLAPQGGHKIRLTGQQTFVGSLGTFRATFTGRATPPGPRQAATGTFELDSGTGAYAGIRGHGTFTVVGDFVTGNVYSVAEGVTEG